MLTHEDVTRYLLREQLIRADAVVDGTLSITACSRRNHNYKVRNEQGTSYFLKQGLDAHRSHSVAHEAAMYEFFADLPNAATCSAHLPRFIRFDREQRLLVLELLTDAQDLRQYQAKGRFSTAFAKELGRALSALHSAPIPTDTDAAACDLKGRLPWILNLHRPDMEVFRDVSSGNLQLIRILQNSGDFCSLLDQLRASWRVDGLVHNDIKWDNCLLERSAANARKGNVRIADWEFGGCGDRCWDAGAIFSNFLSAWLLSIPISGQGSPEQFLELASYPLEKMQPAMRAYWSAYVQGLQLDRTEASARLLRAVRYAGARLIQTGFEQMQLSTQLTGNLVCMLQLSSNIIKRPHEAAAHLLGIFDPVHGDAL